MEPMEFDVVGVIPGTPNKGTPLMVSFPYWSHIFRDSYGSGMGTVWARGPIIGGPWKSLLILGAEPKLPNCWSAGPAFTEPWLLEDWETALSKLHIYPRHTVLVLRILVVKERYIISWKHTSNSIGRVWIFRVVAFHPNMGIRSALWEVPRFKTTIHTVSWGW